MMILKIRTLKYILWFNALIGCALFSPGCRTQNSGSTPAAQQRVVLYCSVDDVYARPLVRQLEAETGLQIETLYDTEATKTAGLAQRIRAERNRPQGDVFWSSALLQTLLLHEEGLLQPYQSASAQDIPAAFKSENGAWTGMGLRARVIVYHRRVKNPPRSLDDLLQPRFKGKVGISDPQFGTGADWAAALATRQGQDKTLQFFRALKNNDVQILPGNSVVAERVARDELLVGVTDTDDYLAQRRNKPQGEAILVASGLPASNREINAVLLPGSVAMLKDAPHPAAARRLMDALTARATEAALVQAMPGVFPLRDLDNKLNWQSGGQDWSFLRQKTPSDTSQWPQAWRAIRDPLAELLILS